MADFVPRREAELAVWALHFTRRVAAEAGRWGVDAAWAARAVTLAEAFAVARAGALTTAGDSTVGRRLKVEAKAALLIEVRRLAGRIRHGCEPTRDELVALGLPLPVRRAGRRGRFGRPATAPLVDVIDLGGGRVRVLLRDAEHPHRVAKPAGVAHALLFTWAGRTAGDRPPLPPGGPGWEVTMTNRTRLTLELPASLPPGGVLHLVARWDGTRNVDGKAHGAAGPFGPPARFVRGGVSITPLPLSTRRPTPHALPAAARAA